MELVEQHGGKYGVNLTLAALGLCKATWYYQRTRKKYVEKHQKLKAPLLAIARAHPYYGYRKVLDELRERGCFVNHKVVRKLQKSWELPILRKVRTPRRSAIRKVVEQIGDRGNLVRRMESIRPFEVLYTDFTELLYDRNRAKAHLMALIDHNSKLVVGWAVGKTKDSELALEAWDRARARLRRLGIKTRKVVVHHDQDGVYTGQKWLSQLLLRDKVRVSYSLNGARGNTAMESFNGHFKAENASILWEQKGLMGVIKVVERGMWYYNDIRRHASLDNLAPSRYLRNNGINA